MTSIDDLRNDYRVFDMAVFDWVATILLSGVISYYNDWDIYQFFGITVVIVLMAIMIHYVTDTPTMLNYYLNISYKPDRKQ